MINKGHILSREFSKCCKCLCRANKDKLQLRQSQGLVEKIAKVTRTLRNPRPLSSEIFKLFIFTFQQLEELLLLSTQLGDHRHQRPREVLGDLDEKQVS